jgi:hypothetical protein
VTSSTFPKEGHELMKQGLEIYSKMTKTWMDLVQLSSKDKPADVMKSWLESLASANKDIFGMFTSTLKMPDLWLTPENAKWDEVFNSLQKSLTAFSFDGTPPFQGVGDFVKFSSGWQESYNKFVFTWLECLQKMAGSYKAGDEEKARAEFFDASEEFLNKWSSFMTEQTKVLFLLWKTSVIKARETAEKKEPKKKASRKKG